jgi:hypothetical protein
MKANLVFKHFKMCCNKIMKSDLVDKATFRFHKLQIVEPLWPEDNIAGLFYWKLYRDLHTESFITIYPNDVLTMCTGWTKDEILMSVANTACHEMAHYLHFSRFMTQMATIQKSAKYACKRYQSHAHHGKIWTKIMREEMGTTPDVQWCKASSIPTILESL